MLSKINKSPHHSLNKIVCELCGEVIEDNDIEPYIYSKEKEVYVHVECLADDLSSFSMELIDEYKNRNLNFLSQSNRKNEKKIQNNNELPIQFDISSRL